jgi:hypothetical protein
MERNVSERMDNGESESVEKSIADIHTFVQQLEKD